MTRLMGRMKAAYLELLTEYRAIQMQMDSANAGVEEGVGGSTSINGIDTAPSTPGALATSGTWVLYFKSAKTMCALLCACCFIMFFAIGGIQSSMIQLDPSEYTHRCLFCSSCEEGSVGCSSLLPLSTFPLDMYSASTWLGPACVLLVWVLCTFVLFKLRGWVLGVQKTITKEIITLSSFSIMVKNPSKHFKDKHEAMSYFGQWGSVRSVHFVFNQRKGHLRLRQAVDANVELAEQGMSPIEDMKHAPHIIRRPPWWCRVTFGFQSLRLLPRDPLFLKYQEFQTREKLAGAMNSVFWAAPRALIVVFEASDCATFCMIEHLPAIVQFVFLLSLKIRKRVSNRSIKWWMFIFPIYCLVGWMLEIRWLHLMKAWLLDYWQKQLTDQQDFSKQADTVEEQDLTSVEMGEIQKPDATDSVKLEEALAAEVSENGPNSPQIAEEVAIDVKRRNAKARARDFIARTFQAAGSAKGIASAYQSKARRLKTKLGGTTIQLGALKHLLASSSLRAKSVKSLGIRRVPNPQDLLWEGLVVPGWQKFLRRAVAGICLFFVVGSGAALAGAIRYSLAALKNRILVRFLSVILAFVALGTNSILDIIANSLLEFQAHQAKGQQLAARAFISVSSRLLNFATQMVAMLLANGQANRAFIEHPGPFQPDNDASIIHSCPSSSLHLSPVPIWPHHNLTAESILPRENTYADVYEMASAGPLFMCGSTNVLCSGVTNKCECLGSFLNSTLAAVSELPTFTQSAHPLETVDESFQQFISYYTFFNNTYRTPGPLSTLFAPALPWITSFRVTSVVQGGGMLTFVAIYVFIKCVSYVVGLMGPFLMERVVNAAKERKRGNSLVSQDISDIHTPNISLLDRLKMIFNDSLVSGAILNNSSALRVAAAVELFGVGVLSSVLCPPLLLFVSIALYFGAKADRIVVTLSKSQQAKVSERMMNESKQESEIDQRRSNVKNEKKLRASSQLITRILNRQSLQLGSETVAVDAVLTAIFAAMLCLVFFTLFSFGWFVLLSSGLDDLWLFISERAFCGCDNDCTTDFWSSAESKIHSPSQIASGQMNKWNFVLSILVLVSIIIVACITWLFYPITQPIRFVFSQIQVARAMSLSSVEDGIADADGYVDPLGDSAVADMQSLVLDSSYQESTSKN